MMGFRFPENFNRPYTAQSVTDFWRRWHISLSNWMRLYLYIPLGGNRTSVARTYVNLWIVFVVSGIWHGASWTFVVWGAYYGCFLCLERALSNSRLAALRPPALLRWALTLLIVMVGWVFFRAPDLHHALRYLGAMFGLAAAPQQRLIPWGLVFGNRELTVMVIGALIACVRIPGAAARFPAALKAAWSERMVLAGHGALAQQFVATLALLLVAMAALASAEYVPFLYFRF
jgi:alginate O-acetyltransferase complex protein AlgI